MLLLMLHTPCLHGFSHESSSSKGCRGLEVCSGSGHRRFSFSQGSHEASSGDCHKQSWGPSVHPRSLLFKYQSKHRQSFRRIKQEEYALHDSCCSAPQSFRDLVLPPPNPFKIPPNANPSLRRHRKSTPVAVCDLTPNIRLPFKA